MAWPKGKKRDPSTIEKMRQIRCSDATRAKISQAAKGRKHTEQTKALMAESKRGKPRPAEVMDRVRATKARYRLAAEARFLNCIDQASYAPCWQWKAARSSTDKGTRPGYGTFVDAHGKQVAAHRWSFEFYRGAIPDGLHIDHLCRNTLCVNPEHLDAVTPSRNAKRGLNGSLRPKDLRGADGRFCRS